jgi:hypothetical protein
MYSGAVACSCAIVCREQLKQVRADRDQCGDEIRERGMAIKRE